MTVSYPNYYSVPYVYPSYQYTYTNPIRSWVCPKCGRVYQECILTCAACNTAVLQEEGKKKDLNLPDGDLRTEIVKALVDGDNVKAARLMGWDWEKVFKELKEKE